MPSIAAWVDTGFLVAIFARDDRHHGSAKEFLRESHGIELHSIWPVVAEASFFLDTRAKGAMLTWLERDPIVFHELSTRDLPRMRATLRKYESLSPDFTDAALVMLAELHGISRIITVDVRDFSAYRVRGQSFERLWL